MTNNQAIKSNFLDKLLYFCATGFYSGLSPKMPGTVGSATCALLILVFDYLFDIEAAMILLAVFVTIFGIYATNHTLRKGLYPTDSDPKQVVIDEFAGMIIALIALPITAWSVAAAFVAFRVFDILKPPPVSNAEQLPEGYGIVLDDVLAGIIANLSLQLLILIGVVSF